MSCLHRIHFGAPIGKFWISQGDDAQKCSLVGRGSSLYFTTQPMLPLVASSKRTADVVASVWRCCVHPTMASSFGSVFSVWFGPAGEQLGLQIIRPHYSGLKRPDSDVRMRRAVIITPRLMASQEPIFLYSHSQNWFKVFCEQHSVHSSSVHLIKVWRLICLPNLYRCNINILMHVNYSKSENSVNIHSPSCCSKCVCCFNPSGMQKPERQFLSVFPLRLA